MLAGDIKALEEERDRKIEEEKAALKAHFDRKVENELGSYISSRNAPRLTPGGTSRRPILAPQEVEQARDMIRNKLRPGYEQSVKESTDRIRQEYALKIYQAKSMNRNRHPLWPEKSAEITEREQEHEIGR